MCCSSRLSKCYWAEWLKVRQCREWEWGQSDFNLCLKNLHRKSDISVKESSSYLSLGWSCQVPQHTVYPTLNLRNTCLIYIATNQEVKCWQVCEWGHYRHKYILGMNLYKSLNHIKWLNIWRFNIYCFFKRHSVRRLYCSWVHFTYIMKTTDLNRDPGNQSKLCVLRRCSRLCAIFIFFVFILNGQQNLLLKM